MLTLTTSKNRSVSRFPRATARFCWPTTGGRPVPDSFYIDEYSGQGSALHYFFSVDREVVTSDLVVMTRSLVKGGELTSDLIPIARDQGGNMICLGVAGERLGQVFFIDHEDPEIEGPIADDLDEFLASFHEPAWTANR